MFPDIHCLEHGVNVSWRYAIIKQISIPSQENQTNNICLVASTKVASVQLIVHIIVTHETKDHLNQNFNESNSLNIITQLLLNNDQIESTY
jgi:amino acid permease